MAHRTELPGLDLSGLAFELTDLRYDVLQRFLSELSDCLLFDAADDEDAKRFELSSKLWTASKAVGMAADAIGEAWEICMKREEE